MGGLRPRVSQQLSSILFQATLSMFFQYLRTKWSAIPPESRNEFDVAVICALPFEADTVDALFDYRWDEESDRYGKAPGDRNTYRTGLIGSHNVVLVCMPGIGRGHAAGVAANLRSSFQNIRLALMVGVCGGVPNGAEKGIFLGDIIISDEIVVYDFGRQYPAGFRRKEGITESTLNPEKAISRSRLLLDVNDVNDIHFGRIASGDTVMKSGTERNRVALADNIIAFEMEGAGIYTNLPCLVVKGIDPMKAPKPIQAHCLKLLMELSHRLSLSLNQYAWTRGSHSQNIHPDPVTGTDQLFQILPEVELAFKETLACFKRKSIRKFLPRDFGLKQYESVEDLESRVQVLLSLMTQAEEPSSFINDTVTANHARNREFKHFQVIQKAAYSLYDALGTACNKHTTHDVHLSLQPSFERSSSQVQFNVAFLQKSASAMQEIWIKVESTIKSADTDSPSISTVTSRRLPSFKRPTQYPEASSSSEVRKRVCFEERIGPDNPRAMYLERPIARIPNLYLQRNFCVLVERVLHRKTCQGCIGLLRDSETWKHLAYLDDKTKSNPSMSLSQLVWLSSIDPMQCMSQYRRIQLAKYLATAVLCYHATPWLNTAWRSDDVRFLGGPESLLQKASCTLPYMVTSVQASSQSSSPSHPSELHYIVRNRVLFGLGVMFLELAYQTPLQKLRLPIDLERGQTPELAEYFTARRVVDQSASMMGGRFKRMIKKCLYCDFGHDSDFTSPALQQAFYNDIIGGLEDLEEKFRELQLDE
ncbi:hypothetical protein N7470_005639 [Penicillium chermesinum]|nr:hypothetical protein N7470_005639 [Penicillium chermesinum]